MLNLRQIEEAKTKAILYYQKAGIFLTEAEKQAIEIADFGLGDLENIGLEVLVYVNTKKVCAKELVMFPGQTCPEHIHPSGKEKSGKEETFRCRWGKVFLYVPGEKSGSPKIEGLDKYKQYLRCDHEIVLNPGDQYTLIPDTWHWFMAGEEGAVVSEFSTTSTDEEDVFADPGINRFTIVEK